jgi:uncharacterized cofD-like protein
VVALGGGHGLAASLTALSQVTDRLTAVVTVADDGGSSGRLRQERGALPPGDLRMALAALASADGRTLATAFQHRFADPGALAGHPVGNLLIVGLCEALGDPVAALDAVAQMLDARGRVLPMSCEPVDIVADIVLPGEAFEDAPIEVRGQVAIATSAGRVISVRLVPPAPVVCPQALDAVVAADFVVLGPGSLFTSVLPHLLQPDLASAVLRGKGRTVLVLNLAAQPGETAGFSPEAHLEALAVQVPGLAVDVVIADPAVVPDVAALRRSVTDLGASLHLAPVAVEGQPAHDPERLATAFRAVMRGDR